MCVDFRKYFASPLQTGGKTHSVDGHWSNNSLSTCLPSTSWWSIHHSQIAYLDRLFTWMSYKSWWDKERFIDQLECFPWSLFHFFEKDCQQSSSFCRVAKFWRPISMFFHSSNNWLNLFTSRCAYNPWRARCEFHFCFVFQFGRVHNKP